MKAYGVMVIGCGHIGCEHLANIYYQEDIRIAAVVDVSADAARLAARKYGAAAWGTDYRAYLDSPEVDIVIVATYPSSHLDIVQDCVAHGKHVLCEKPIATNAAEGMAFCDLMESSPCKVQVAHVLRYNRTYQHVRKLLQGGAIGELKAVRMVQNHHALNWPRYKALLKDCIPAVDCGVHYYDVMRWFTGNEVAEVSGYGIKMDEDSPDLNYNVVNFRMENGCVGYYEAGWSRNIAAANQKEFIGTRGRITLTLADQRGDERFEGDRITLVDSEGTTRLYDVPSQYKNMYGQLEALIRCIETGAETTPSPNDIRQAFLVSMASEKAIRTGKTVKLVNEEATP